MYISCFIIVSGVVLNLNTASSASFDDDDDDDDDQCCDKHPVLKNSQCCFDSFEGCNKLQRLDLEECVLVRSLFF